MHVCFTRDLKLNILSWVYNYAYMRDVKREGIWATLSLFMLRTELHCYHSLLLMLTCSFFRNFIASQNTKHTRYRLTMMLDLVSWYLCTIQICRPFDVGRAWPSAIRGACL